MYYTPEDNRNVSTDLPIYRNYFRHYVKQYETWLSLISATLSLGMSVASEIVKCTDKEIKSGECWLMHCISVAILLGWVQMMLLIGRFPMWGYYALMFSTVLKNILKVGPETLPLLSISLEFS